MAVEAIESQALLQWPEAVDYTSARGTGDVVLAGLSAGVYRVGLREAAKSNGVYLASDIRVELGMGDLADGDAEFPPKPRDVVAWTDTPGAAEPDDHVVIDVSGDKWLRFWVVTARCPKIAYDLRQWCTVQRPNPTGTASGLRTRTLTDLAADVDCRLQPEANEVEPDTLGGVTTRRRFAAFLAGSHDLRAGDVLLSEGVRYEVTGQGDIDDLGVLTRVTCELLIP